MVYRECWAQGNEANEPMKIYCDSSTTEYCLVLEGREPQVVTYPAPVTNNVGEYQAVIEAIKLALSLKLKDALILTDSQLVVEQVNGMWKCRQPHLLPLRDKARELLKGSSITLTWTPRENNLAGKVLE